MRVFLKRVIEYMLASYLVLTLFENITLPENTIYYFSCFFLLSFVTFISSFILSFLTIKKNILTLFLMSSILCIGVFLLFNAFLPGFFIQESSFEGFNTTNLVINSFEVTPIITIVLSSISYSFLTTVMNLLEKTS
jgi:hypothetical protein